jgi:hypothetical protein
VLHISIAILHFIINTTEFFNIGQTREKTYNPNDPTKYIEKVIDYTYSPQHLQLAQIKNNHK